MVEKHWVVKFWVQESGYPERVIVWAASAKQAVEEAIRHFSRAVVKVEVQVA
jgi:hypothetical protein